MQENSPNAFELLKPNEQRLLEEAWAIEDLVKSTFEQCKSDELSLIFFPLWEMENIFFQYHAMAKEIEEAGETPLRSSEDAQLSFERARHRLLDMLENGEIHLDFFLRGHDQEAAKKFITKFMTEMRQKHPATTVDVPSDELDIRIILDIRLPKSE